MGADEIVTILKKHRHRERGICRCGVVLRAPLTWEAHVAGFLSGNNDEGKCRAEILLGGGVAALTEIVRMDPEALVRVSAVLEALSPPVHSLTEAASGEKVSD